MSRTAVPLQVADLSPFAKSLRQSLAGHLTAHEGAPSHVELLNMLAKAAGFANYQHLRADAEAADRLTAATAPAPRADTELVARTARYFDSEGQLTSWPSRFAVQTLSQWVFWSRIPRGNVYTEREISEAIKAWHRFGDHAIIRRAMVDAGMLERRNGGREYRRVERMPPPELEPLLRHLAARATAA